MVQWNIYVDSVLDVSGSGLGSLMLIGDDLGDGTGPNGSDASHFVCMAFRKEGGGDTGIMDLVVLGRHENWSSPTVIARGLSLDQWYMIKVTCDLISDTYDVYIDDILVEKYMSSRNKKGSVTHVSFAQSDDSAGTFYVDNVTGFSAGTPILVDSDFAASTDSADLRDNGAGRDWYESNDDLSAILTLDVEDVGNNMTKKARLDEGPSGKVYLTQEFNPPQSE